MLPFISCSALVSLIIYYFTFVVTPNLLLIPLFVFILMASIFAAVFASTCVRWVWRTCKLPQHGFMTGAHTECSCLLLVHFDRKLQN